MAVQKEVKCPWCKEKILVNMEETEEDSKPTLIDCPKCGKPLLTKTSVKKIIKLKVSKVRI